MRVLSWNINGLRSVVARVGSLKALLESLEADVICFQETKLRRSELERELAVAEGWESFFVFSSNKAGPGYCGVATFCRTATASIPVAMEQGLTGTAAEAPTAAATAANSSSSNFSSSDPFQLQQALGLEMEQLQALDSEGRAIITDHGPFLLVNLYGPALSSEDKLEERLQFKLNFYQVLELRLRQWLAAGRAVLIVGDLNISPQPIDSCSPYPLDLFERRPDRLWLNKLLGPQGPGVADVFRVFHPHRTKAYTCWNTATGARVNNWGTRIDHILAAGVAPPGLAPASAAGNNKGAGAGFSSSCPPLASAAAGDPAIAATAAEPALRHRLIKLITACDIMPMYEGSDHAPVWADLDIPVRALPAGHAAPAGAGSRLFAKQASLKAWLQQPPKQPQPQQQAALEGAAAGLQQGQQHKQQQGLENVQPGLLSFQPGGLAAASSSVGAFQQSSQHSSQRSSSGRPANTAKRKQAGGQDSSSSKRGQASLLGFVRRPSGLQAAGEPAGATAGDGGRPAAAAAGAAGGSVGGGAGLAGSIAGAAGLQQADQGTGQGQQQQLQQMAASDLPASDLPGQQQWQAAGAGEADSVSEAAAGASQPQGSHQQRSQVSSSVAQQHAQHPEQQQQPGLPQQQQGLPQQQQHSTTQQQQRQQQQQQQQQQQAALEGDAPSVQQALTDHQQQTVAAWQRISRAMQPPTCRHGEPSVIRSVKKRGPNQGRQFFVCARPAGAFPAGRCDYFLWANERREKQSSGQGSR